MVFLGELFLRFTGIWVGRHSDTMFEIIQSDQELGWRMKPNINREINLVDVEGIPIRSNRDGFWDDEFVEAKRPGVCRIAFLGDSFTWGMGVREEQRFTNLVEKTNANWETLNFGVPGYGTDQAFLLWHRMTKRYGPDLVVLTIYQNDYSDNLHSVRSGRAKPFFELGENGGLEPKTQPDFLNGFWDNGVFNEIAFPYRSFFKQPIERRSRVMHWLAKNSDLARLSYTIFRSVSFIKSVGAQDSVETLPLTVTQEVEVKLLGALVKALSDSVRAQGGSFLAVFSGNLTPEHLAEMEELGREGIPYLDATTKRLEMKLRGDTEEIYYPYSRHWTPVANAIVADFLSRKIREEGLCVTARSVK